MHNLLPPLAPESQTKSAREKKKFLRLIGLSFPSRFIAHLVHIYRRPCFQSHRFS